MYLAVVVTELSIAAVGTVVTIGTVGIVVNVVTKLTAKSYSKILMHPPTLPLSGQLLGHSLNNNL